MSRLVAAPRECRSTWPTGFPGQGAWVFVCGPSGAGKDSVMAWARDALAGETRLHFARRLVTRHAPSAWDDGVSAPALQALLADGQLAWHWQAHGLLYGVHRSYAACVMAGDVVVVNGSRTHARELAGRADVRCVVITAPQPLLAARLHARGREDAPAVARRLHRNAASVLPAADLVIRNDADLGRAGDALSVYLRELVR